MVAFARQKAGITRKTVVSLKAETEGWLRSRVSRRRRDHAEWPKAAVLPRDVRRRWTYVVAFARQKAGITRKTVVSLKAETEGWLSGRKRRS